MTHGWLIVIAIVGVAQIYLLIGIKEALAGISRRFDDANSDIGEIRDEVAGPNGPVKVEVVTVVRPKH